jgi:hypothetical protein
MLCETASLPVSKEGKLECVREEFGKQTGAV